MNDSFEIIITQQEHTKYKQNQLLINKLKFNIEQLHNHLTIKKRDYQELINNHLNQIKQLSKNSLKLSKNILKEEEKYERLQDDYYRRQKQLLEKCLGMSIQIENLNRNIQNHKKQAISKQQIGEKRLDQLKKQNNNLQKEIKLKNIEIAQIKAQNNISNLQNQQNIKKLQNLQEQHDKQLLQFTQKYDYLQQKYQQSISKIQQLQDNIKCQQINNQIENTKITIIYKIKIKQLQQLLTQNTKSYDIKINEKNQQNKQLFQKIITIQQILIKEKQQKNNLKINNQSLQQQLNLFYQEKQKLIKLNYQLKQQIQNSKQLIYKKQVINNQLQNDYLLKIKNYQINIDNYKKQKQNLEINIYQLKNIIDQTRNQNQQLTKLIQQLKFKLQNGQNQQIRLKLQYEKLKILKQQKQGMNNNRLDELLQKINQYQIIIENFKQQKQVINKQKDNLNLQFLDKNEQFLKQIEQYTQLVYHKNIKIQQKQNEIYGLVKRLQQQLTSIQNLQKNIAEVSSSYNSLKKQQTFYLNNIKQLKNDLEMQKTQKQYLKTQDSAKWIKFAQKMRILSSQIITLKQNNDQNLQIIQITKKQIANQILSLRQAIIQKTSQLFQVKNKQKEEIIYKAYHSQLKQMPNQQLHLDQLLDYINYFVNKLEKKYSNSLCIQTWKNCKKDLQQNYKSLRQSIKNETPKFYYQALQSQLIQQLQKLKIKRQQTLNILFLYLKWIISLN